MAATSDCRPLFEKCRPTTWAEVIGQTTALATINLLRERGGLSGRAYWIAGPSGTGKTTIAYLLAQEIADPLCVHELDASLLTASELRDIEGTMRLYGWGATKKTGRAYIINEAHGLGKAAVRQLLTVLEPLPRHVAVIFTSSKEKTCLFEDMEEAGPLMSRCTVLRLTSYGMAPLFAERAKAIAAAEGLNGRDMKQYLKLAERCKNNFRAMLSCVEAGEMLAGPAKEEG